ncbi:MAG: GNAT family N-acetyltransferase [Clostridia bacterium]|nr:GNAT family N-acetyltransferase [Clostridia bacterium]
MEIRPYTDFQLEEIMALYASVGWVNYTRRPEMLAAAYQNSLCSFAAFEGEIVGVIRAVGDGASVLLIQDLIVHPAYQRRGVGSLLLRAMKESFRLRAE